MQTESDDLLRPTLDADLDVRAFGRPFRPRSILWPTFFGGPIAGGVLFGINYRRLGRAELAWRAWVGGVVVAVVIAIAMGFWLVDDDGDLRDVGRLPRYVAAAVGIACGTIVAKHQERRFTAWDSNSGAPASLWLPGLAATIGGAAAMLGLVLIAMAARGAFRA